MMYYYFINHTPCRSETKLTDAAEITEEQYNAFVDAINNFNLTAPDGKYYRLEADLTWQLYELPPAEEPMDETAAKAQAYDILTGGAE